MNALQAKNDKTLTQRPPLLAVQGLGVDFKVAAQPHPAVSDVALTIDHGEILALVGESGSGKSVTSLALLGLLPSSTEVTGSAKLQGAEDPAPQELIGAGREVLRQIRGRRIGAIFQDPFTSFNPVMRVGAQVVEALTVHDRAVTNDAARTRGIDLLSRVGLSDPERAFRSFPHELSGGQLQRAMIATAIACNPKLLIADEPTTALDVTVQAGILDLLHDLRRDLGMAILLITHDMGVVADLADTVAVMRDGVILETGPATEIFAHPTSHYTAELLQAVPRVDHVADDAAPTAASDGGTAAQIENVTITYGSRHQSVLAVDDVSFEIERAQTVGLVGESGSGKTTLGKALVRLLPVAGGRITVADQDLVKLGAKQLRCARAGIGFVFQNPGDSLDPRARVDAIISEPLQLHATNSREEQLRRVDELLERVHLPSSMKSRFPHQLSGGQRQRVAIARALVLNPQLVIADEPTSALDVAVQAGILKLFAELQAEFGFGCLFISHDLAVVRQVAHRVVVMRGGKIVESGSTDQVLTNPSDPYTQQLLASVPVPDPEIQHARRLALQA